MRESLWSSLWGRARQLRERRPRRSTLGSFLLVGQRNLRTDVNSLQYHTKQEFALALELGLTIPNHMPLQPQTWLAAERIKPHGREKAPLQRRSARKGVGHLWCLWLSGACAAIVPEVLPPYSPRWSSIGTVDKGAAAASLPHNPPNNLLA